MATKKEKYPKAIRNMITRAYHRGEKSSNAAERINNSATATRLGVTLTPGQVAATYAWITMRS